ncbi:hypothetical protein ABPG72_007035 [Tetrahymena utriculariae]
MNFSIDKTQDFNNTQSKSKNNKRVYRQKLNIADRIHCFDYISWSALVLVFTSIWQIAIPFSWVDAGTEKWLGTVSIFILIYSFVLLAWSKHNHSTHKEFYAKSLLHQRFKGQNSNPTSIQELIRPSTLLDFQDLDNLDEDESDIEISGTSFAKFSFVMCLMLIIFLSGLLIGNEIFEGYFKAIEEANNLFSGENDSYKMTYVLLLSQTLCTLLSIINLLYIVYEMTRLCLYPFDFSSNINYFFCTFCCVSNVCFLFHIYLQDYIKVKKVENLQHQGLITQIGIISFVSGLSTFLLMFYNFFNTRSKKPNQSYYVWFTVIYFVVGGILFAQSLIIYMDVKNSYQNIHGSCIQGVRDYSKTFLESIGCPQKYFMTKYYKNEIYDMNCKEENIGLVWEDDLYKEISQKKNNRSCLNMNCCKLIGEFDAVQFWTFLILSTILCSNSMVLFFFCLILYTYKDKQVIRLTTKTLSSSKFAVFVLFILVFVSISSLAYIFVDLQEYTVPPKRPEISFSKNSTNLATHNQTFTKFYDLSRNYDQQIISNFSQNSSKKQVYQDIIPQSKIKGCRNAINYIKSQIEFQKYEQQLCKNTTYACNINFGYQVCLNGTKGAFSLSPTFLSKTVRINDFQIWDPFRIIKGKEGQILEDSICFSAVQQDCVSFLTNHLYFCVNENIQDSEIKGMISLQQISEISLKFPSISDGVSILSQQEIELEKKENDNLKKQLVFNHHEKKKEEKKETKKKDLITIYQQGDQDWINLVITTFGVESGDILDESEILVYPEAQDCEQINYKLNFPIRKQITDANGQSIIHNLPWGLTYAIHYHHDDFLMNCIVINSNDVSRGTSFPIQAPLAYKFKDRETFKILLSWSTPILSLRISGTFNYGNQLQCQVGFYQPECGGMKSYNSQKFPSQVITLDEIGQFEYLFYVEHLQEYVNLRNIQDFEEIDMMNEDKQHLKMLNQLFYQSNALVKVYVKERPQPVSEYRIPPFQMSQLTRKRHPIWLTLCLDGKVGSISQTPLNKYWEKVDQPINFWQSSKGSQSLPDSSTCTKFYESKKQKL